MRSDITNLWSLVRAGMGVRRRRGEGGRSGGVRLIRLLDRHVFRRFVTLLGERPDLVVEVNVSALSAVVDLSWEAVFVSLSDMPNIAHRLAVVISNAASVDSRGGVRATPATTRMSCLGFVSPLG